MAKAAVRHKAVEVLSQDVVRTYPPVKRQASTRLQRGMTQGVAPNECRRRANMKQASHTRQRRVTGLVEVARKVGSLAWADPDSCWHFWGRIKH